MTGFRRRDPDATAVRGGAGDDRSRTARTKPLRLSPLRCVTLVAAVALLAGCQRPEVEIIASRNGSSRVVFGSNLGNDHLLRDADLHVSYYDWPRYDLTLDVDSPASNIELLAFPFDANYSFTTLAVGGCGSGNCAIDVGFPPQGQEFGFVHPGGAHTYPVGFALSDANPTFEQVAIKSLYMRKHGECEFGLDWTDVFSQLLDNAQDTSGKLLGFIPYSLHFSRRIARSYLRQTSTDIVFQDTSSGRGRGGIGAFLQGDFSFSAASESFRIRARYDVILSDGVPQLTANVATGNPQVYIYDCSPTCLYTDTIRGYVKNAVSGLVSTMNKNIKQCMEHPVATRAQCSSPEFCGGGIGAVLGFYAFQEAVARGASNVQASAFRNKLTDPKSWDCAPVSDQCASLTNTDATENNVCQIKLRAVDLVPMPGQANLVWYPGGIPSTSPTAAEALYLALQNLGQTDTLDQLCSGNPRSVMVRAFANVSK